MKWIIVIVIAIGIVSYFGFDLKSIFESDTAKKNYAWFWNIVVYVWQHFLSMPAQWVWDNVVVDIIWKLFKFGLENIGNLVKSSSAN